MERTQQAYQTLQNNIERVMTQKQKQLLLVDLCARLQNKVMIYLYTSSEITGSTIVLNSSIYGFIEDVLNNSPYEIKEIKPYLRPMSSMTEEERDEYTDIKKGEYNGCVLTGKGDPDTEFLLVDWLNKHHFDYRGLIEKGLALEATKGMYSTD